MNFIIFPVNLYEDIDILNNYKTIYVMEHPRFFTDFGFHKLKLAYHRATLKSYFAYLSSTLKSQKVIYVEYNKKLDLNEATIYDVNDIILIKQLKKEIKDLKILDNPNFTFTNDFINNVDNNKEFYNEKGFNFMNFYKWQRKRLDILMTQDKKPYGNNWTYDILNRNKFKKGETIPKDKINDENNKYKEEAFKYIENNFKDNYGNLIMDNFIYPIDTKGAKNLLKEFIKNKLLNFGHYQDAIISNRVILYHSYISCALNIGLLTDNYIIKKIKKINPTKDNIASLEGFIRQIIGWRNYTYAIYVIYGDKLRLKNNLGNKNKINYKYMWEGKTGLKPIDDSINKIKDYAYAHHIERLMILGNYMLLLKADPYIVYKLFMEWTIDAYDWVMLYNVYGMSQYADNIFNKRPYICSSNYVLKISDYKKSDKGWQEVLNALYFYFLYKKKNLLKNIHIINFQINIWERMDQSKKNLIIKTAKAHIKYMT
jgi:deoxyribodipyrimidine photolyase-related protein